MKISKERLLQIIKEEIEDATKLKTGSLSTSADLQKAKERVAAGGEFTAQERNIVSQIQDFVTNIANIPNVDLPRYKPALERALKYMEKVIGADKARQTGEEQ